MTSLQDLDAVVCTLVADGSSDRVLLPILEWLLEQHCTADIELQFADHLPAGASTLQERIRLAADYYPCHLLFVHRDAESEDPALRQEQIQAAWAGSGVVAPLVTVIPVRMTEAWLLLDELAIRGAAGNPNGTSALHLPQPGRLEQQRDPKLALFEALRVASGLSPTRLRGFQPEARRHRVTELMRATNQGFGPLRRLSSFARLESQVVQVFAN